MGYISPMSCLLLAKRSIKHMEFSLITIASGFILVLFSMALGWIDYRTHRLPNKLTFSLMLVGLLNGYITNKAIESFIGLALGYLIFFSLEYFYKIIKNKEAIGRGDAKLLAAGGAWCGWIGLPYIILIASSTGLLAVLFFKKKLLKPNGHIPFGPFLAFAITMVWISSTYIW
jgi:leader peptidase (prepilin peptidase)/N-methyltransferase